jgi:hypothetical protein
MRFIYYAILFRHYKLIQLGRAGKLWSACSASISFPTIFTISLHFSLGELFGVEKLIEYRSITYGTIFLISFVLINFYLFVNQSKYLKIEEEFLNSRKKSLWSYLIFALYLVWVILIFYLASHPY